MLLLRHIMLVRGRLLVPVLGRVVVLVRRLLVNGQISHDELLSGALCVLIGRHIVDLGLLLAGLVPAMDEDDITAGEQTHKTHKHTCCLASPLGFSQTVQERWMTFCHFLPLYSDVCVPAHSRAVNHDFSGNYLNPN